MRPRSVQLRLYAAMVLAACSFFASAHPSFAFGLSPPEVEITRTLYSSTTVTESVGLQRGEGEVGTLVFSVSFHGECDGCVTGENTVIIGPAADSVEYEFSVSPGAEIYSGDYRQYIAFLLDLDSGEDGSGNAVQRGVTATIKFTVSGGPNDGGGGSGGGGSSSGGSGGTDAGTTAPPATDTTVGEPTADTSLSETPDETVLPETDVPSESAPVPLFPSPPVGERDEEIGGPTAPGIDEDPASPEFSFDLNGDGSVDESDSLALVDAYFAGTCSSACDANGDGTFDLADISLLAERIAPDGRVREIPPVLPGPPLAEDLTRLYFEEGSEVGQYQFSLAAGDKQPEDLVTFYLLADTGPSGIQTADVTFRYDPAALNLVDVSIVGSIFPHLRGAFKEDGLGSIRFVGATNDPFVGTRGYVAAFQFRPIKAGETTLAFGNAITTSANGTDLIPAITLDLSGTLRIKPATIAVNEIAAVAAAPCGCLDPGKFPICLLLAMTALLSLVSLVVLRKLRSAERRENNQTVIELPYEHW